MFLLLSAASLLLYLLDGLQSRTPGRQHRGDSRWTSAASGDRDVERVLADLAAHPSDDVTPRPGTGGAHRRASASRVPEPSFVGVRLRAGRAGTR